MKRYLFFSLILILTACSEQTPDSKEQVAEQPEEVVESPKDTASTPPPVEEVKSNLTELLRGFYVGEFKATKYDVDKNYVYYNKINISIDSIAGDSLYGHSVVAGNNRPFQGSIQKSGETYIAKVREPGDDRYDGAFDFEIIPKRNRLKGSWKAYNTKLAVSERGYDLYKQAFSYNPALLLPEDIRWAELYETNEEIKEEGEFVTEDVLKFNPSTTLLVKEDVENMYKGDLEIIRNSIYARHGYSFKNRKMRFVFDKYVEWYIPVSTDIRHLLTQVEKKNIDLLKRYEQHAERYYDTFGR